MADISVIMVMFKGEGSANFYFEKVQRAHEAYGSLCNARMKSDLTQIDDDYGTRATVDGGEIRAIVLQNMTEHTKVVVEVQMVNARASAALQKRQLADPSLRFMGGAGLQNGQLIA